MAINNVSFDKIQQFNLNQNATTIITAKTEVAIFSANNSQSGLSSINQPIPTAQAILSDPANANIIKERIQFILDQKLFEAKLAEDQDGMTIINKQIESLDSISPENAVKFLAELNNTKIKSKTAKPFIDLILFTLNLELGIATDSVGSLKDSGAEGAYKKLLKTFVSKLRKEFNIDQAGSGNINDVINKGNSLIIRLRSITDRLKDSKDRPKATTSTENAVKKNDNKKNTFLSKTQSLNKEILEGKDISVDSSTNKASKGNIFSLNNPLEDETTRKKEILIELMEKLFGADPLSEDF